MQGGVELAHLPDVREVLLPQLLARPPTLLHGVLQPASMLGVVAV